MAKFAFDPKIWDSRWTYLHWWNSLQMNIWNIWNKADFRYTNMCNIRCAWVKARHPQRCPYMPTGLHYSRTICHAWDLENWFSLVNSYAYYDHHTREIYHVLPYSVDFKALRELWNPIIKDSLLPFQLKYTLHIFQDWKQGWGGGGGGGGGGWGWGWGCKWGAYSS